MSAPEADPPDDDLDVLAGEFCLGLLDAQGLARVAQIQFASGALQFILRYEII